LIKKFHRMTGLFMRFALPLTLSLFAASSLAAQTTDRDVMVVFDMSGSMWGQVDGVAKVEIARDAFDGLLGDWQSNDTRTGLVAYGHRERGNCADIETLAVPGDGSDIAAIVAGLSPIGKTPLSDAVRQAAEVLRFTEEAATVVLLSDGVETCSADPCAVGAELEALGLDFTAHVIGFDIAEADKAQLQCLANATGGQYFDAADAGELADAMDGVMQATAEPAVEMAQTHPVNIRISMPYGVVLPRETIIFLGDEELGRLSDNDVVVPGLTVDLPLGTVTLRAVGDKASGEFTFEISSETEILELELTPAQDDYILQSASVLPIINEHIILIKNTSGVNRDIQSRVYVAPVGSTDLNAFIGGSSMSTNAGVFNQARIPSPDLAGDYEIVVMDARNIVEYARFAIRFSDGVTPEWLGPREADVGGTLDALWLGDANRSAAFRFYKDGSAYGRSTVVSNMATQDGFKLTVPDEAGLYDLVFFWRDADNNRFESGMGQFAVVQPLVDIDEASDGAQNDPASDTTVPYVDTADLDAETDAMGGEEGELFPVGDMHGDWILMAGNDAFNVPLARFQVIHEDGTMTADGDLVIDAPDEWELGSQGSFGTSKLTIVDENTRTLTLVTDTSTRTVELTRDGNGWRAPSDLIAQRSRTTLDVMVLRRADLAAVDSALVQSILQAFDERGTPIATPVDWVVESPGAQDFDEVRSDTGLYQTNAQAQGTYVVTATSGQLSGKEIITVSRSSRANNGIILRGIDEGDELPFDTAYFCSVGENCDMREPQLSVEFTLPEGWGAERPFRTRQWEIIFNMATITPDGAFWATLNQPQRSADLGPCYSVIDGNFCHDMTDDPEILADIAIIRRSLSLKSVGAPLDQDSLDTLLNRLTGDSQ
jgi:Ca-activated chloride channel family protein